MNRVLDHIEGHLGEPLDLPALAEVANFSPYHFHRLFAAWMGETLGDYLRRRRLEVAAWRLAASPRPTVLEVALEVGFGSGEALARAFKQHFKLTPTQWQRQGPQRNLDQARRKPGQTPGTASGDDGHSFNPYAGVSMNVRLIELPPARVAYLRHIGPYGPTVGEFWRQTAGPWMIAHQLLHAPRYGISLDDPSITAPDKCRYDAAVDWAGGVPPSPASVAELPGGRYAVADFTGTAAEINAAWQALVGGWLPDSGLQFDGRPCFERYLPTHGMDPKTGAFSCELCLPVKPL
jgi:AraC family transcriptional regulator